MSIRAQGNTLPVSKKEMLHELLEFAKATDLREVRWEKNGTVVHFRLRDPGHVPGPLVASMPVSPAVAETQASPEPVFIRSTMVGTFFRSESPERPPLVVEGTIVSAGQPVAAVEAMKIIKDVVAPFSCRIIKAHVENHHPVEYGQVLFEVEPVEDNV